MVSWSNNRRKVNHRKSSDEMNNHKDRFIDLAQAALDEADMEEDRKGVIHEVMEALIAKTGAPLVAEVISEQLRCQDVIEKIAAEHYQEETLRKRSTSPLNRVDSTESLKEPDSDFEEEELSEKVISSSLSDTMSIPIIAEYLWRFFRVLILSSLVGLVYHFLALK